MKRRYTVWICLAFVLTLILPVFSGCGETPLRIVFLGNSLQYTGDVPENFDAICKANNKKVEVRQNLFPNATLKDQIDALSENPNLNEWLDWADVVVMNEYGAAQQFGSLDVTPATSIPKLQALFREGTKFYYLFNDLDEGLSRKDALNAADVEVEFIPTIATHEALIDGGAFTYAQLHWETDFHPNKLYGYASALTTYCQLFAVKAADVQQAPSEEVMELLPGETDEEKQAALVALQQLWTLQLAKM